MKKKIFSLLAMLLVMCTAISPAFAEGDAATSDPAADYVIGNGGLDFYSITFHYDKEVLVSYAKSTKNVNDFGTVEDGTMIKSNKYIYRAADTHGNCYELKDETTKDVVKYGATGRNTNFYQVSCTDAGIFADAYYIAGGKGAEDTYDGAYITHIQDGAVIKSKSSVSIYGILDLFDDDGDQNPNLFYNEAGYVIDQEVDPNGQNYLIDINGYRFNTDNIWTGTDGTRVELFYEVMAYYKVGTLNKSGNKYNVQVKGTGQYVYIPIADRLDENGKIKNKRDIYYTVGCTKEAYDNFTTVNGDPKFDDILVLDVLSEEQQEDTATYRKQSFTLTPSLLYKIKLDDVNKDGILSAEDAALTEGYMSPDRVFTQDDIYVDASGRLMNATPAYGIPKIDHKITGITIEFDATGTQLYTDLTQDPQQNNTITLTFNDMLANCERYNEGLSYGAITKDDVYGTIVGSVKSQTTRTETPSDYSAWGEYKDSSPSKASVAFDLSEEVLASLPRTAVIYLNFDINTHQEDTIGGNRIGDYLWGSKKKISDKNPLPSEDWPNDGTYAFYENQLISVAETVIDRFSPTPVPASEGGLPTIALIGIIAGGVVVVAAAVTIPVVVSSKKKKA